VGDGTDPESKLGPINNEPQYERVKELVADAISGGARPVTGGHAMDRPGYFFEPTILADITDGTRIVDEEQFGPALPVISYRNLDDALERANSTHFGLSGSVWSADPERAAQVASELECGTAWVNTHRLLHPAALRRLQVERRGRGERAVGLSEFTEIQALYRSRAADGLNVTTAGWSPEPAQSAKRLKNDHMVVVASTWKVVKPVMALIDRLKALPGHAWPPPRMM